MSAWRIPALIGFLIISGSHALQAAEVFRALESGAGAIFDSFDGCIQTSVSLRAFKRVERQPPTAAQPSAELFFSIEQYNQCTGTFLPSRVGRASGTDVTVEIDAKLNSASVTATATVVDESGVSSAVTVRVSWTATGPAMYDNFSDHVHQRGFSYSARFSGSERAAAATATILDGGVNLTPNPGQFGSIEEFREATVTVGVFEEAGAARRRQQAP